MIVARDQAALFEVALPDILDRARGVDGMQDRLHDVGDEIAEARRRVLQGAARHIRPRDRVQLREQRGIGDGRAGGRRCRTVQLSEQCGIGDGRCHQSASQLPSALRP
ncbi:hypothetical protein ACM41_24265 [Bradyrhizobium sp. CCBAU 21362]|nr:hypothetical protein [Bradyrhizobium sp. CCBAU 21362]